MKESGRWLILFPIIATMWICADPGWWQVCILQITVESRPKTDAFNNVGAIGMQVIVLYNINGARTARVLRASCREMRRETERNFVALVRKKRTHYLTNICVIWT